MMTSDKLTKQEANYKLYLDSIRKDLDIILTSTIPTQKNLMKTLMWINTTIIGFSVSGYRADIGTHIFALPFIFSLGVVLILLFSLKKGQTKSFGTPHIEHITNIKENRYLHYQALLNMSQSYEIAFENNADIVQARANMISKATNLTIASIIFLAIIIMIKSNL